MSKRLFPNWLDGFLNYTSAVESPIRLRLWAGISAIAAVLERRVWINVKARPMFPNQYIILVGQAGVGKSNAVMEARRLLLDVKIKLTPNYATKERLLELMGKEGQTIKKNPLDPTQLLITSAVCIASQEFGVFLRKNDFEYMDILTDLWDSPDVFDYETKGSGKSHIENVYVNMLTGTTPQWLGEALPMSAYDKGFAARLMLIYEDRPVFNALFGEPMDEDIKKALIKDLEQMKHLEGEIKFSPEARQSLVTWYNDGLRPQLLDPRFASYNTRRLPHFLKLVTVVSIAYSNDLIITQEHFERTQAILFDAESAMVNSLAATGKNEYMTVIDRATQHIVQQWHIHKKATTEGELRRLIMRDVQPQHMSYVIQVMIDTGILHVDGTGMGRLFRPNIKKETA